MFHFGVDLLSGTKKGQTSCPYNTLINFPNYPLFTIGRVTTKLNIMKLILIRTR